MRARPRASTVAILLTVGLLGTGCGIGQQESAETIDLSLDGDLLPAPATSTPDSDPARVNVVVFMVDENRLVKRPRSVDSAGSVTETIVDALGAGPTPSEEAAHLWSAVPPSTVLHSANAADGTVAIDLSSEFAAICGQDEILAVAQIVLSLTSLPGVSGVEFQVDGLATDVPGLGGALISGPATFDDYQNLIAP